MRRPTNHTKKKLLKLDGWNAKAKSVAISQPILIGGSGKKITVSFESLAMSEPGQFRDRLGKTMAVMARRQRFRRDFPTKATSPVPVGAGLIAYTLNFIIRRQSYR